MQLAYALLSLCVVSGIAAVYASQGTVYYNSSSSNYYYQDGVIDKVNGLAWGTFDDTVNVTGWGVLHVATSSSSGGASVTDQQRMFAAGYVEAVLTAARIFEQSENINYYFFKGSPAPVKVTNWLNEQEQWTQLMIENNPTDNFWIQTGLIIGQYEGLIAGYINNQAPGQERTRLDFQVLNGVGDLLDLMSFLTPDGVINWKDMTQEEFEDAVFKRSLCSALIKVTGDLSRLFGAHASWFTFSATNRIYKHYNFDLNQPFIAAKTVSFSSYPGFLESLDDFYMMSSNLVMIQTTNNIFNTSLYNLVSPQSLLAWHRVRIASSMAHTDMVIDYNLFKSGQELQPNTLWVVEQVPGLMAGGDVTKELERGYFPSYNVPYWENIYNISGYPDMVQKHGESMSYQLAPRAQIFRRDQTKVTDLESLKAIMRYNDYQHDPYSKGDASNAICSRGDLSSRKTPGGCYDGKVTSDELVGSMTSYAINGPTVGDGSLPPFAWSPDFDSYPHVGLPPVYQFQFVQQTPNFP